MRKNLGAAEPDRWAFRPARPRCSVRDWIRWRSAGRNVSEQVRLRGQRTEQHRQRNACGEQTGPSALHHAALPRLVWLTHRAPNADHRRFVRPEPCYHRLTLNGIRAAWRGNRPLPHLRSGTARVRAFELSSRSSQEIDHAVAALHTESETPDRPDAVATNRLQENLAGGGLLII